MLDILSTNRKTPFSAIREAGQIGQRDAGGSLSSDQRVLRLDNFRKTRGFGFNGFKRFKTSRQDKGHNAEFSAFVDQLSSGGEPLIPLDELVNATLASFAAMTAAAERRVVVLGDEYTDLLV